MNTEGQTPNETPEVEPQDGQPETNTPEVFDRAYVEKLRRENASYRTRAKELEDKIATEERQRLERAPLEERLKALELEREGLTKRAEAAEEARVTAERLASLTGKVASPKAALKLLEDTHVTDDGVNVDALLKDYPFLAPQPERPSAPAATGAPEGSNRPLKAEDFRGKPQEWIEKNLHRLKGRAT